MRQVFFFCCLALLSMSCNKAKETAKAVVNKSGEVVGQAATEFGEGIAEGVDKTLECQVSLSKSLTDKGIKTGKFAIDSDSLGHVNNVLSMYLIFDKAFNGQIVAKVNDKNNTEIGRVRLPVHVEAGAAGYYDFVFDKRTYIEVKSQIVLE
jgi:TRAP-type C4-dicarboxylate transport system substrate-binding protein